MGTAGPYPYPEPTDPIAQGADAIKALAQAIDTNLPTRVQVGSGTVPATGQPLQVTYPVAFTGAATVVVQGAGSASPTRIFAINNHSTTGFQVYCANNVGTAVSGFFIYIAVQP